VHTHISATHLIPGFLGVVLVGTFWRLTAAHLGASSNSTAKNIAKAMAFQY
jgi:hypothetical protein